MKITHKIGVVIGVGAVLTNPLLGQYINQAVDAAFARMFSVGAYVSLVAFGYFSVLYALHMYQTRNITKVPSKASKMGHKTPKFIET